MELDLPEKLYYSIGELAKAFQVNSSLIRFWEKEFEQLNPKKNTKGVRRYSQSDLESLKLIYFLVKEQGYTLEGAKVYLSKNTQPFSKLELIENLERIKKTLIELKGYL